MFAAHPEPPLVIPIEATENPRVAVNCAWFPPFGPFDGATVTVGALVYPEPPLTRVRLAMPALPNGLTVVIAVPVVQAAAPEQAGAAGGAAVVPSV
jgi:hypothetical protein